MDRIGAYLISVTAAALLSGMITRLSGGGAVGAAVRLTAGIMMALVVVSPLVNIRLSSLAQLGSGIEQQAQQITADGENKAREELAAIITERTRSYILDKAEDLGAEIRVEVVLSQDSLPVPCAVTVYGAVSPYAKSVLSDCLEDELGILSEDQTWIQS